MSFTEILPLVESLPHPDKFRLMHFLLARLAQEEGVRLQEPETGLPEMLYGIQGMAEQDGDPWANPDLPMPSVDTGIHDLVLNHDHYLYGAPKKS